MCGIAGILSTSKYQENLEILMQRMQTALQHRGPDDQGIYISQNRQVAFAHTRLSILDLSSAGHQPMSTENERYWIIFNGEIYNFRELRHNLESQGVIFDSQTDTEVILKLYQQKGVHCVHDLRGMFALISHLLLLDNTLCVVYLCSMLVFCLSLRIFVVLGILSTI